MNSKKLPSRRGAKKLSDNTGTKHKKSTPKNSTNKSTANKTVSEKATLNTGVAKRESKAAETNADKATQTAAQRKQIEAALYKLIERFASEQLRLVRAVRKWLQARLPTAHEIVYEYRDFFLISYSPSTHGYEGVLAVRGGADSVQLYFNRGKELTDPAKLLKGSAKLVRYIVIDSAATLKRPEFIQLVEQAIIQNSVAFATEGQGTIILSPSTAKKK